MASNPILSDVAAKTVNALYQNFIKRLKNLFIAPKARQILHKTAQRALSTM